MYLIKDRRPWADHFVFTHTDPRKDGYRGEVTEDVSLDYDMNAIHLWPDGTPSPQPQLGRDPDNAKHYKVFKFPQDLAGARFEFIYHNVPIVAKSWREYREWFPMPAELARTLEQPEWDTYLDEIDEATRQRRQSHSEAELLPGSNRDRIAEWVAKRHLTADGGIRAVWYLPVGAPADELRLLEVNERISPLSAKIEPFDFGLEIDGKSYKLLVADVAGSLFERLKRDPSMLPAGWTLQEARNWGRRT